MDGVFWINPTTWLLEKIEFRYTGLRHLDQAENQRGVVELRVSSDGIWYVPRWHIRVPIPQTGTAQWPGRRLTDAQAVHTSRIIGYTERAGRILHR